MIGQAMCVRLISIEIYYILYKQGQRSYVNHKDKVFPVEKMLVCKYKLIHCCGSRVFSEKPEY